MGKNIIFIYFIFIFLWNSWMQVNFLRNVKMALYWFHSWEKGGGLIREGVLYAVFYGSSYWPAVCPDFGIFGKVKIACVCESDNRDF